jgi:hypothetical protein
MPRNEKRTTQKAEWTTLNFDMAVKSFKEDTKFVYSHGRKRQQSSK